jgi:hypothetical protein
MILKVNWKKILYVVYMIFVINVPYGFFTTDYSVQLSLIMALYGLCIVTLDLIGRHRIDRMLVLGIKAFIIPMGIITIISVICAIKIHHTQNISDVNQSIVRWMRYSYAFMIAYLSFKWFKKDAPRLFIIAGLISYSTVFIRYFVVGGTYALTHIFGEINLEDARNGVSLEVHNLTYCLGLFFVFYLLSDKYSISEKLKMCGILAIAIIFGNKRTLYFAMLITLLVYYLFHKVRIQRTLLGIFSIMYIIVAFVYLWSIKSGMYQMMITALNINDMSRLKFWNYFSDSYEISIKYWGRGISYTDNIMGKSQTMADMRVTSATTIHNDLLRAYIGWGFIPFLYYLVNIFIFRTKEFLNIPSKTNAWRYFAIVSYTFFLYFFDNMIVAINYNVVFFLIWFLLMEVKDEQGKFCTIEYSDNYCRSSL